MIIKNKYYFSLLITLPLFLCFLACNSNQPQYRVQLIQYTACKNVPDDPGHYEERYNCVKVSGFNFPTPEVVSAVIYINESKEVGEEDFGKPFSTDDHFLEALTTITGDSSNFRWGEAGTSHVLYRVDFLDADNVVVNRAAFCNCGMLWLTPSSGIDKWGGLSIKGDSLTNKLLWDYTN